MIKKLLFSIRFFIVFAVLLLSSFLAFAQNCSVNAGTNTTICPGDQFNLKATSTGSSASGITWSQVGGPAVTITPTTAGEAKITNYIPGGVYRFRATTKCADGSTVFQEVTYTVSDLTVANAGPDRVVCPGVVQLTGSPLKPGEIGRWIKTSGNGPEPSNANIANPTLTFPVSTSSSKSTYTYTITNSSTNCISVDEVTITNLGTAPVNAGLDQDLSCYNITNSTYLNGSAAGRDDAAGQLGTWTFVSGPSNPTIANPNNNGTNVSGLVKGTYIFRWTVTGPCVNGSDDVSITVGDPNQNITYAGGNNSVYCDGRTTVLLSAPAAAFANEVVEWVKIDGPGNPVITSSKSNVTTVTGLNSAPGNSYTFRYTIRNTVTNCSSSGNYVVSFNKAPTINISTASPYFAGCGENFAVVNYSVDGGRETKYALVSAPAGSQLQASFGGLNNYVTPPASGQEIRGFDKSGTYILRYRRSTDGGIGGCEDAYAEVKIVISANIQASNAGTSQILNCDVVETDLVGNTPLLGVGRWSQVSGPNQANIADPLDRGSRVTGLVPGKYTFRWLISGGDGNCTNAQSDVDVLVSTATRTASAAGSAQNTCAGIPVILDGNIPVNGNEIGTWTVSPSAGVTFSNIHDPKASATGLQANTTYTFTWTITGACGAASASSVTVTTNNIVAVTQANAGIDQCRATTGQITLAGNAPAASETGLWTLVSGPSSGASFVNANLYNTQVNITQVGNYVFRWSITANGGCSPSTDEVLVTVGTPTVATVGSAIQGCVGSGQITLSGNQPTVGTGTWTQTEGAGGAVITDIHNPTSTVTGLMAGRYKFRWTITGSSCSTSSSAELTVNLSDPAAPAIAGADQTICGVSTTLDATPVSSGTGRWVVVSGPNIPTFASTANPRTSISNLVYGRYELQWITSGGLFCGDNSDNVIITVREAANAGADQNLCNVNSVSLNGNSNSTGTWTATNWPGYPAVTNQPTITTVGSNAAIANVVASGNYTFRYTIADNGTCADVDEVTYNISTPPTIADAGPDQELCEASATPKPFQLAANTPLPGTGTGRWIIEAGSVGGTFTSVNLTTSPTPGPYTSPVNDPNAIFTPSNEGVSLLKWEISNGNCNGMSASSDYVRITMYYPPSIANAGTNQDLNCENSTTLSATVPTRGFGKWTQTAGPAGAIIEYPNASTTKVSGLQVGDYTFTWTVTNGTVCSPSIGNVNVKVNTIPPVTANAGADQTLCFNSATVNTTLAGNAPGAGDTGLWTVQSGTAAAVSFTNASSATTSVSFSQAGTYTLRWTTTKTTGGCTTADDMTVTVVSREEAVIITPNNSEFCWYTPVALDATTTTPNAGTWKAIIKPTGAPDPVFSAPNGNHTEVFGLNVGTYQFSYTTNNGVCGDVNSNIVNIIIRELPTPSAAGVSKTTCYGVNVALAAEAVTVGTGKWTVTDLPPGANNTSYTFSNDASNTSNFKATVAGVYTLTWTTSNGTCTSESTTKVTVQPALAGNQIATPPTQTCSGTNIGTINNIALASGGPGAGYTYQWQSSTNNTTWNDISNATGTSYAPGTLNNTTTADITYYYRRLASAGTCEKLPSNVVNILVRPSIKNNTLNPPTATACFEGAPGTLTGSTPTGGDNTYTYQWQRSLNSTNNADYSNVPDEGGLNDGKHDTYTPASITNAGNTNLVYRYRRIVTSDGCPNTSAVVTFTIYPKPILTSSATATVCSNSLFSYTPTSNVTSGVTFNWTRAAVAGINANAGSGSGSISETLVNNTANPIVVRYVYRLIANSCANPDTYNVDVTVNPSPRGTNATVSSLTCGNSSFTYDLQANVNAVLATSFPSNFTWTVAPNANVTGQASGSGNTINQTLINTSNVAQQVVYTVTPTAQAGAPCAGQPFTVTVTVPVCEGVTITKTTTRTTPITAAGNTIPYTIVVTNTGNAAQHNVVVNDPFLGGVLSNPVKTGGNADNILDKGETWTYTGTYTVTQADLDNYGKPVIGSGKIANTATLATTERPTPQTAGTDVAITANSSFTVAKTSGTTLITEAGQVVPYTITVTNTGNTAISNVVVNDPMLTNITLASGDTNGNGIFERSENTWVFSGSYIVKQSDLDNNGNVTPANGRLKNTVSVSGKGPNGTSLTPVTSVFEIPVSTTAGSFDVKKSSTTTAITKAGQVVPYTITIANTGKTAVSNIQVIDPLLGTITNVGNLFSGDIEPKNNKLDVNETWTYTGSYTVTQTDIDNRGNDATNLDKLLNVAEVRGTYPNGTQEVKNTNRVLIDITPYAAYKIEKTSTETEITKANDLIHYTVKVTNTGDAAISDVVVSDPMVTNLARNSGDTNNNNKLDVNEVWTYTGTYAVKQTDIDGNGNGIAGILRNIATVNGKKPDGTSLNPETATHLIPLKTTTAFNVVKTANRTEVTTAGEQITYTIAVTNTGVTAISNLVVNDPMLSNVPLVNPTKTNGNTDNILDLGEVWTYTGTYTVTQADIDNQGNAYPVGTLTNVVNVTGNKPDGSSAGSVSKILNLPINAAASLVLAKTSDVTTVNKAGDIITYTVTAQNTGKVAIENLLIDDAMLKLKYISGDNGPVNGKLDVGETWTYRGAYTVTQADIDNNGNAIVAGKLVNEVTASGRKPDGSLIPTPTPARNEVTVTPNRGLAIVKATTATSITKVGQVVPYTIRVTNTGTVAVSNVVVNDPLITAAALTLTYGDANANNKLDINETWIYEVNYTVKQSDIDNHGYPTTNSGELVNRATVAGQTPQGAITTVTSNDTRVPLQALAAYSIEKTANKAAILAVGDVVRYTITVKNTGDAAISNVVVNDPMLSNAALANPTDANNKLDVGETWTYQADYIVKQSDIDNNGNTLVKGVLSNTATLSGQAPNNNALPVLSSTRVIPLTTSTSFTVQKTANKANVNKVGDVITYTITVKNTGGTAVTNVVVNDPLTGGIIPTPKSGDDKVGGTIGVLDEGETWIYEVTYTVTQSDIDNHGNSLSGGQSTAKGNILNLVTVTGTKPDGSSAGTITAQNEVPIVPTSSFTLTKTSDRDGSSVTKAGDPVVYTVEVKNTGSVAINSLVVKDPMVSLIYDSGDANNDGKLDVAETWVYKGTYLTTQEDIDRNGNGVTVGKLVNVVAANGRTPNGTPVYISDLTATNSVTITANAAMTVKKATSTKNIRNAGQVVTYAITVANTGTVAIHDVMVNDPLLGGNVTTLYSGDVNGNGIMDVRETWTFTGNYTVTQADIDQYGNPTANSGLLVNTADAAGKLPDNSPITGTSNTVSIPILLEPAYSIEKTSTTTEVTVANQVVPYVITIKNTGNSAIKDVVVNDPMLTNLAYANGDTNSDGKLDVNEVWTYQGSYVVTQGDIDNNGNTVLKGVLSNTASLNGKGMTGIALAPLTSTKIIPLKTSTLFTVTKTSDRDGGSVNKAGDIINYQIKVANTSVTAITKVVVNDPLLGGIMAIPTSGDVANPGVLDVNEIWTYTGSYTVTQADMDRNGNAMANNNVYANGSIINVVNVSGEKPDGTSAGRVTATNVVPIQPAAALNVTKTSDVATVNKAGDIITYTVKVTNAGTVAMNTIMVADPMVNLLYVNGDANNNGKLEVGEEWTYTGKYTVTQADLDNNGNGITAGKLVNEVSVQGRQPNGTLSPTATAIANVDLVKASAMTISKTTTTTQITAAGQLVNYTITIANTGKSAISNVVVNDPLLANLAYNNGDINGNNKLDVNETWTYGGSYIITQADIDQIKNAPVSGQFRNIASVTGTNPDGSAIGPFTSTKDIPVSQIISVDFKKVVTGQVGFIAGQLVNYEIKVINTGNTTLKNIVVKDPNATITSGSPIAQLNPGQTVLVLAQHVLTQADVDAGKVINQAELEGVDPNGDKITKKSDDPSTATPNDPTVVQIVSPGSISLVKKAVLSGDGNTITYSFEVNNPGIVTLSDVTISDPKFSSPIAVVPSVLPPRSKGTATAVYTISAIEKLAGQVSNTAIVTGVMPNGFKVNDISGTNENNNEPTLVVLPKITSKKTVVDANGNGKIEPGEELTYTITISNDGDVNRTNVKVDDVLPAHTSYVNGSASNGGSLNSGKISWTNLTVPAKSSLSVSFKALIDATLPLGLTQIENIASVIDPAKPNEAITPAVSLPTEGKIESSKTVNDNKGNKDGLAQANEILTYSIVLSNKGGSLLTGVQVKDVLPAGLTYVDGSANNGGTYTASANQMAWTIDLAPGTTKTLTFDVKVAADVNAITKITNTASVLSPTGQSLQPSTSLDTDPSADLEITKVLLTPAPVKTGDYVSYQITVKNLGQNKATGVTVTDPLPGTLDIPGDIKQDKGTTNFDRGNKTLSWTIGDLELNEQRTMTFKIRVVAAGSLVNTANVTANQPDLNMANNKMASGGQYIDGPELLIPNLFTPNGDGNNDAFEILGLNQYANNELVIVNRWGNELFRTKNYQNNWTGEGLNEGTYYYLLRVQKNSSSEWITFKGYVTLIRAFKK
ncbi:DUF7507 domain-containing protein [Pedobacter ureilyticus]|uniref:PKD domain-containing protein n=1 Tax=Pedobacter ureilyticus TaxID=1393051 RepID=A0ABW9J5U8_9SPHI|nr:gliding motility-associated C-terminal domain-containing protein [Pedobacter helvus]